MEERKVEIQKSNRSDKKYMAIFTIGKRNYKVHFGASGYSDYTIHNDEKRMLRYRARHRNDHIDQFDSPGALSWWILWNKPSLEESIEDYRKHFGFE